MFHLLIGTNSFLELQINLTTCCIRGGVRGYFYFLFVFFDLNILEFYDSTGAAGPENEAPAAAVPLTSSRGSSESVQGEFC